MSLRRFALIPILLLVALWMAASSGAQNIHVRYFESADVLLVERSFQIFSLATLEDEEITLVAYGLDEGLVPTLSVFDQNGVTLAENLNPEGLPVVSLTWQTEANALYTFLVGRQGQAAGLMRVMAFEGDPLSGDLSFLDTVDPLLPSRAYLVAGDEERPIAMAVAVTSEGQQDPAADLGTIYASRGTEFSLPAADERTAAIQQAAWENDRGDTFYTLNVRALPEVTFTSQKLGGQLRQAAQFLDVVTVQVDIGQGSEDGEVDFLSRPVCTGEIGSAGAEILAGPSSQYRSLGRLAPGQDVELLGENGDYYLIVSPTSPTGGAWVLKSALMGVDTGGLACSRFQPFPPPILDGSNSANPGGGGNDPLVGLPPLGGDGPNDNPGPGDSSIVIPPPDSPPPSNPPPAPPGQTSSFLAAYVECIDLGDGDYDVTVSYSGASGTEFTLNIGGVPFVTSGPVPDGAVSFYVSGISLGGSVSGGTLSDGLTTVPVGGSAECFFSWGD